MTYVGRVLCFILRHSRKGCEDIVLSGFHGCILRGLVLHRQERVRNLFGISSPPCEC